MSELPRFGAELRRRRTEAGLSLTDMARLTYYSKSYLSKVETGRASANQQFCRICDSVLGANGALLALARGDSSTDRRRSVHVLDPPPGLPSDTNYFTGRAAESRRIIRFLRDINVHAEKTHVYVISGMAGVGKTALVVHLAHRLGDRFPQGCLFLDLHGYTGTVSPMSPADALDRLLRRLGVLSDRIPEPTDEKMALYRQRFATRRMLLVLDNAHSAEQVWPLLPATAECRVLVTSRRRLTALDEASQLDLEPLPAPDASALFRSVAKEEEAVNDELIGRIVRFCGGLPLAIRVAAARHRDSGRTFAELGQQLADEHARLDELQDGERSVAAAFAVSYANLSARQRRTFVLLGLHPGPSWDAYAAAALTGESIRETEWDLDQLLGAHLVSSQAPGRYRFHDLLAAYARRSEIAEEDRLEAVLRLGRFYRAHRGISVVVAYERRASPPRTLPARRFAARGGPRLDAAVRPDRGARRRGSPRTAVHAVLHCQPRFRGHVRPLLGDRMVHGHHVRQVCARAYGAGVARPPAMADYDVSARCPPPGVLRQEGTVYKFRHQRLWDQLADAPEPRR